MKTTEELAREAGIHFATAPTGNVGDYFWCETNELETFRRLVLEEERRNAEPVGHRYRHSEGEKWQYGERLVALWEHQPLYTFPPVQIPAGWQLVPIEPTAEMEFAGDKKASELALRPKGFWYWGAIFKAMLSAAPKEGE